MDPDEVTAIAAQVLNQAAALIEFRLADLLLERPEFVDTPYGMGLADGMALVARGLRVPID